jgi:glycosyltransferase involved in cell wall biosynthesis
MVCHGTISRRLGIDLIVRAVARLVHEIPGFELHIYGEGDDLNDVIRLTESLGIAAHVHFHDLVPWERLPEELKTMDVGIVGNRKNVATELMLPAKLIDYVRLNIPAIVPELRTIRHYFSPDTVSYFEPENVDSIVDATIKLYRDNGRRQQQAQRAKAFLEKYGWDNNQSNLRDLYDGD